MNFIIDGIEYKLLIIHLNSVSTIQKARFSGNIKLKHYFRFQQHKLILIIQKQLYTIYLFLSLYRREKIMHNSFQSIHKGISCGF